MKIDRTEFDKGIASIQNCVQKFAAALAEMDPQEHEKIVEAGNWFYANLNEKLVPLRQNVKKKVELCVDEHDYDGVLVLLDCLKELDKVQASVMELKK